MPLLNKVPGGGGKANGTEELFTVTGEGIKSGDFVELYDDIKVGDELLKGFGDSLQVNENQFLTAASVSTAWMNLSLFEIDKSTLTVSLKSSFGTPIASYGRVVSSCLVDENLVLIVVGANVTFGYLFDVSNGQITQIGSATELLKGSISKATIHKLKDNLCLMTWNIYADSGIHPSIAILLSTENRTITIVSELNVTTLEGVKLSYSSNIVCYAPGEFLWLRSRFPGTTAVSGYPSLETYAHKLYCSENKITTTPPVLVDNTHNGYDISSSNIFLTEWNEIIYKACIKVSQHSSNVAIHIARVPIANPENANFTLVTENVSIQNTNALGPLLQIGKNLYSAFGESCVFAIDREEIKVGPYIKFPLRVPSVYSNIPTIPKSGTFIIPVWDYKDSSSTSYKGNWNMAVVSVAPSLQLIVERFVNYTTSCTTYPRDLYSLADDLFMIRSHGPNADGTDKPGNRFTMIQHTTYVRKSKGKIDGIALSSGVDGETIKISRCLGGG